MERELALGFDSDKSPEAEQSPMCVLLQKDKKPICWSRPSRVLSFRVPSVWTIGNFVNKWECTLPSFRLQPEPQDPRQRKEWLTFLSFLRNNKKVAVVETKICKFYVFPPKEVFEAAPATVHYDTLQVHCSHIKGHQSGNISRTPVFSDSQKAVKVESARKNLVRTDPSYLVTLSQAHAGWVFGAIAELVDNSRDAKAARLDISITSLYSKNDQKKIPVLSVIDNGCGMTHEEVVRMLSFGHKQPKEDDPDHIGRFGIGFKTGAMKLGRDAIVLTQTLTSRSVAFLSQSFNENKENLEIPIISYRKHGNYMEIDLDVQSEETAALHLQAIKKFSPFNEYFIGEKVGLFGENGAGTQIYIWNLENWGSDYSLEWQDLKNDANDLPKSQGDILVRSRRIRSRPGQISKKAYKRVGGMIHNADFGRGVIGVVDVTDLMTDGSSNVWVLNNKQGFQDCESYAILEEWLGKKSDEYWDTNYDPVRLEKVTGSYKSCSYWVQCNKCLKWRVLGKGYDMSSLPSEWFCYMSPFNGRCEIPQEEEGPGELTVELTRSGCGQENTVSKHQQNLVQRKSTCQVIENYGDSHNTKTKSGSLLKLKPTETESVQKLGHTCIAYSEVFGSDLEETKRDEELIKSRYISEAHSDGDSSTISDFPHILNTECAPKLAPLKRLRRGLRKESRDHPRDYKKQCV